MKKYNSKIVVNPYGEDMYMYSQIKDPSVLHGLMRHFPENASIEELITRKVRYWSRYADCFKPNLAIDGINKWSILPYNTLCIDINEWKGKENYSLNDGINGEVVVAHTPNHRGIKGTEFIIKAIEDLKLQGIKVKLILLEKKQNSEVKRVLYEEADILVEQLIFTAYALSGVEGMASGLPVLANLDSEVYTRVFRRYSYLNECPILSTTPENITDNLKLLIKNPMLRKELGVAGRKYVEKYHSYEAGAYMFKKIYDKIWYGKDVDLLNLYHPLNPDSYNNLSPRIQHPLFENKLPSK
jgi:glycosyltransferase involved in cell wall biosynthesis